MYNTLNNELISHVDHHYIKQWSDLILCPIHDNLQAIGAGVSGSILSKNIDIAVSLFYLIQVSSFIWGVKENSFQDKLCIHHVYFFPYQS